ncbi:DUF397 domain-containing protein [Streptomyces sp. NPDC057445]|uniref:DUF397 domain-containing protein n=1 Tax=Streptomyces sp. NPDC057445 TaxID=3346136 RepID=UPI00369D021C
MNTAETNTVELTWFKSSHSGAEGGECVEVAAGPGTVHLRDSKDMAGPTLRVASEGWSAFVEFAAQG